MKQIPMIEGESEREKLGESSGRRYARRTAH